ncbi:unnamed protein product [Linum trigynum]|uniref:Uncharacterized protein n=1 Tax=Linum trigynum TaxID=586398 RepID=A0AAV2FD16_9ROSI
MSYKNIERKLELLISGQPQKPQNDLLSNTGNNPKKEEVAFIWTRMRAFKIFPSMKKEEEKKEADYPSLLRNLIEASGGAEVAISLLEKMILIEDLKGKMEISMEDDDKGKEKDITIKKTPWGFVEFILVNDVKKDPGHIVITWKKV